MGKNDALVTIEDLQVEFKTREGIVRALRGVNLDIRRGETLGLVGESGCGKSMTARAIMGLIPKPGKITAGNIRLHRDGTSNPIQLESLDPRSDSMGQIRGKEIAMVFQEPMTSFSPIHTVGHQIGEMVELHLGVDKKKARDRAIEVLSLVGIPEPEQRVDAYPFQLSGGMRQRAMIAMALSCNPALLIADEPTTALDVTTQAQILELLRSLQMQLGMSILLITHNIGVVAALSHRIAVMYLGEVVEEGSVEEVLSNPAHPYTQGLLKSMPRLGHRTGERLWSIEGSLPDAYTSLPGCAFHPRCWLARPDICDKQKPPAVRVSDHHSASCLLIGEPR